MKNLKLLLVLFTFLSLFGCKSFNPDPARDFSDLQITVNQQHFLQYDLLMETSQMGIERKDTIQCTFDFSSKDTLIGTRFAFQDDQTNMIFDGEKYFSSIPEDRVVSIIEKPTKNRMISHMPLWNSPYFLKKLIPIVLENPKATITFIEKTIIGGAKCHTYDISLTDYDVSLSGDLQKMPGKITKYRLSINTQTKLPTQFTIFLDSTTFLKGTYSNYKMVPEAENDYWSIDRMPKDFIRMSAREYYEIRKARKQKMIGSPAPDFKLKDINGMEIQLNSFKGNPVLLEFWFPTCGFCIEAVPGVNSISDSFISKGLKVLGIEFSEVENKYVLNFINENKVTTPTLLNGKEVAVKYGISSGPTFVLLDKDHNIVYIKTGLNEEELRTKIKEQL